MTANAGPATDIAGREIRLASRPVGEPTLDNFALVRTTVPRPGPGQIVVRNAWMSVDPYMLLHMSDVPSDVFPPYQIDAPLEGAAIGEVIASRSESVPVGSTVSHYLGWREYSIVDAVDATVVDTQLAPLPAYLGALGTTGLTAYAALTDVAPVRDGDVVFVSAAAGAVGSVAGQLARRFGAARVIGSAGGPEKSRMLVEAFGFDAGLDYRAGPIAVQLANVAPDGIDVYIDNVGGDHLEAAIGALNTGGRVALIGAISGYRATEPISGPNNLFRAVEKELTLRGMQVTSYFDSFPDYIKLAASWLADGSLHTEQTVRTGIDEAPAAFLGVLRGANIGKMLVRLDG